MKRVSFIWASMVLWTIGLAAPGCGPGEPKPVEFQAEYDKPAAKHILTVTELQAPAGYKAGAITAGSYIVRGKYDLTGTNFDHGLVRFEMSSGDFSIQLPNDGKGLTEEQLMSASQPYVAVSKDQPQGTFELRIGFKEVRNGKGLPVVTFAGNQKPGAGTITVHERVELK